MVCTQHSSTFPLDYSVAVSISNELHMVSSVKFDFFFSLLFNVWTWNNNKRAKPKMREKERKIEKSHNMQMQSNNRFRFSCKIKWCTKLKIAKEKWNFIQHSVAENIYFPMHRTWSHTLHICCTKRFIWIHLFVWFVNSFCFLMHDILFFTFIFFIFSFVSV